MENEFPATEVRTVDVDCPLCHSSNVEKTEAVTKDFCYRTCANEFQYVSCADCGNIYLKNRPVLDALSVIYPDNYLTYDYENSLGSFIYKLRSKVQAAKISPIKRYAAGDDIIVDIGCGAGDYLDLIAAHGSPDWRVVGIDLSEQAVQRVQDKGHQAIHGRVEEITADSLSNVGVFVMNQLIEHVEDPSAVLRNCWTILRPGGHMIIETPNHLAWEAKWFRNRYWGGWHAPRHWTIFSPESLTKLAEDIGFEPVSVEFTLNPFSILHSLQYYLTEKRNMPKLARHFDVDSVIALTFGSSFDLLQKILTGRTSNQRVIIRKPEM